MSILLAREPAQANRMEDQPLIRFIVILMLIMIVGSLGSAFFSLFRSKGQSTNTVKALTIRVGLSIALFALLMILASLGIIKPH
jgi:membrane associated rhomboid family serine protease